MEPKVFCQSCSMPIDNLEVRGTEKDGSNSDQYCKYCYQDGTFTQPNMTFDEMKKTVVSEMEKQHLPDPVIQRSLNILSSLKRWQSSGSSDKSTERIIYSNIL